MARVACLMMQKNENHLLKSWISYHADLFGLANLYVYDNGSSSRETHGILAEYQVQGMNVSYEFDRREDYGRKGEIVSNGISELDEKGIYDLFIPLDCDEFIVLQTDAGHFSVQKDTIHHYLDQFTSLGKPSILSVSATLANTLGRPNHFWLWKYRKLFVTRNAGLAFDHGYHQVIGATSIEEVPTRIVYVHFHYRPYENLLEHSKEKLALRVDVEDMTALSRFDGRGWHLAQYFLSGPDTYYSRFRAGGTLEFSGLADRLRELGANVPFDHFRLPEGSLPLAR